MRTKQSSLQPKKAAEMKKRKEHTNPARQTNTRHVPIEFELNLYTIIAVHYGNAPKWKSKSNASGASKIKQKTPVDTNQILKRDKWQGGTGGANRNQKKGKNLGQGPFDQAERPQQSKH